LILWRVIFIDGDEDPYRQQYACYCQADIDLFHQGVLPVHLLLGSFAGLDIADYDDGVLMLIRRGWILHFVEAIN
jgi:hypothetical protein